MKENCKLLCVEIVKIKAYFCMSLEYYVSIDLMLFTIHLFLYINFVFVFFRKGEIFR